MDDEYKYSLPSKLSTIIEERTIDINVTVDTSHLANKVVQVITQPTNISQKRIQADIKDKKGVYDPSGLGVF